jgi:hypothetical protein
MLQVYTYSISAKYSVAAKNQIILVFKMGKGAGSTKK